MSLMRQRLEELQNADGGFKAYHVHDVDSGLWTTALSVHVLCKTFPKAPIAGLEAAFRHLLESQNEDGGWPFRKGGRSITGITGWSCLALSHTSEHWDAVERGVRFLLEARLNTHGEVEAAWGLTSYEPDRVYSTHVATNTLARLLQRHADRFDESLQAEMRTALDEARQWLRSTCREDGGWGPTPAQPSNASSSALALIALFIQGENPKEYLRSLDFLLTQQSEGAWPVEREIVITREGYELVQDWFTSAFCFRALVFFCELDLLSLPTLEGHFEQMEGLVEVDGLVRPAPGELPNLAWTVPNMIEVYAKHLELIRSRRRDYLQFLREREKQQIEQRKAAVLEVLQTRFPYPVSQSFSQYQHELDPHRQFQLLLQCQEVLIKYAAFVLLAGYLTSGKAEDEINTIIDSRLTRPSLGDWARLLHALLASADSSAKILEPYSPESVTDSRPPYLEGDGKGANLVEALEHLVKLRNELSGHGALRSLYEYKVMVEKEEEGLFSMIDRLRFLGDCQSFLVLDTEYDEFGEGDRYRIRILNGLSISDDDLTTTIRLAEGQRDQFIRYIYFQNTAANRIVNLYPFLSFMHCEVCKGERFFFYNGTGGKEAVRYLSFECGHQASCDNFSHLERRFKNAGISFADSTEGGSPSKNRG